MDRSRGGGRNRQNEHPKDVVRTFSGRTKTYQPCAGADLHPESSLQQPASHGDELQWSAAQCSDYSVACMQAWTVRVWH